MNTHDSRAATAGYRFARNATGDGEGWQVWPPAAPGPGTATPS